MKQEMVCSFILFGSGILSEKDKILPETKLHLCVTVYERLCLCVWMRVCSKHQRWIRDPKMVRRPPFLGHHVSIESL